MKKQVTDLQKKNQGGTASPAVASPVVVPSKANQNELDEKTKQIADLKRVENLLREENQKLLILNNQLKKDLDFALQINEQNNKTQRRVKNYFFIDEAVDTEASEEIKRVEQCLSAILRSQEVEFSNVFELNEFFKIDSGRRKFTQMLEKEMIDGPNNRVLSQSSFELLLFLINTTLTEMDVSDSSDLITAKILMRAASIFKRIVDGQDEYILTFINQYSVYHDINFWEELFWGIFFLPSFLASSFAILPSPFLFLPSPQFSTISLHYNSSSPIFFRLYFLLPPIYLFFLFLSFSFSLFHSWNGFIDVENFQMNYLSFTNKEDLEKRNCTLWITV